HAASTCSYRHSLHDALPILGRGGPDVSAVGLGMWQAGGKAWGSDVRDADCRQAMERAVELGINLVDTAEAYGDGHSERVMSRARSEEHTSELQSRFDLVCRL